jgi:hypothetical protein
MCKIKLIFFKIFKYLCPELLQSDEFWLLESSSSSRDVPIDEAGTSPEMTVSVGLRGSFDRLAPVTVVEIVVEIPVVVADAINFCGSIGSIYKVLLWFVQKKEITNLIY